MTEKEKAKPAYDGLRHEFRIKSENLCRHSLPPEIWDGWNWAQFREIDQSIPAVPNHESRNLAKLAAVDKHLFELLAPKNMAPPDRRMLPHDRADLNKYRGWLLNRLLRQMHDMEKAVADKDETKPYAYIIPEDLSKIVDDLYLFHKHVTGKDANIADCRTLDDLSLLVKPYQKIHPLDPAERIAAHMRFLETATPDQLTGLLPEGYQASSVHVTAASAPDTIARCGGAKLIDVLDNGTEVIHIKSEAAGLAYGSPRWCTAYRGSRNYFSDYQDNLIIVLAADGQRWQLHFRSSQVRRGDDTPIDLPSLLKEQPRLDGALKKYFRGEWQDAFKNNRFESQAHLLHFAIRFPELAEDVALKDLIRMVQGTIDKKAKGNVLRDLNSFFAAFPGHLPSEEADMALLMSIFKLKARSFDAPAIVKVFRNVSDTLMLSYALAHAGKDIVDSIFTDGRSSLNVWSIPVSWHVALQREFEKRLNACFASGDDSVLTHIAQHLANQEFNDRPMNADSKRTSVWWELIQASPNLVVFEPDENAAFNLRQYIFLKDAFWSGQCNELNENSEHFRILLKHLETKPVLAKHFDRAVERLFRNWASGKSNFDFASLPIIDDIVNTTKVIPSWKALADKHGIDLSCRSATCQHHDEPILPPATRPARSRRQRTKPASKDI